MKKSEEMYGTARMAIKLRDGSKVYIDKMYIDDKETYIVKMPVGSMISGVDIPEYSVIVFKKMLMDKDEITLKTIIENNVAYKEVYSVGNDGYLYSYYQSYTPMLEESITSKEMFLELSNVVEISTDLDMFNEMMQERRILARPFDLARYGLYYSQVKVLNKKLAKKD